MIFFFTYWFPQTKFNLFAQLLSFKNIHNYILVVFLLDKAIQYFRQSLCSV